MIHRMRDFQEEVTGLPGAEIVRKALGLSVTDLIQITGKTESHWRKVETGVTNCSMPIADRVAAFMCCTVDDLRRDQLSELKLVDIRISFLHKRLAEAQAERVGIINCIQDKKAGAA